MKKLFVLLLFVFTLLAGEYESGFQAGYEAGYCYGEYACLAPIAPIAPIPYIGQNTYQDGYNRGFVAGRNAKANSNW